MYIYTLFMYISDPLVMLAQVQPKLDGEDSLILNILNPCCFEALDGSQFNKVRAMQIVERIRSVRKESKAYFFFSVVVVVVVVFQTIMFSTLEKQPNLLFQSVICKIIQL